MRHLKAAPLWPVLSSRSMTLTHKTAATATAAILARSSRISSLSSKNRVIGATPPTLFSHKPFPPFISKILQFSYSTAIKPSNVQYPYIYPENNPEIKQAYPLGIDRDISHLPSKDGYYTASFYCFTPIPTHELDRLRLDMIKWSVLLSNPAVAKLDSFEKQCEYMLKQQQLINVDFIKPLKWKLALTGRIYIEENGINAQVSFLGKYQRHLRFLIENNPWLKGRIPPFNYALTHCNAFKKFHVRVRPLVSTGSSSAYDIQTLTNEPSYLTPQQWHNELAAKDKNKIVVDMRNHYEFLVGKFEGAVCPDVDTFREEMDYFRSQYGDKKDKEIYMYCTGGIRCSVAGAILKKEGFKNIKTLKGGVIAYGKWIKKQNSHKESHSKVNKIAHDSISQSQFLAQPPNTKKAATATPEQTQVSPPLSSPISLTTTTNSKILAEPTPISDSHPHLDSIFIGKNFTFDKRLGEPITTHVLGNCHQCGAPDDTYTNCANTVCNILFIQCNSCKKEHLNTCGSKQCIDSVILKDQKMKEQEQIVLKAKKKNPNAQPQNFKPGIPALHDYKTSVRPEVVFRKLRKAPK